MCFDLKLRNVLFLVLSIKNCLKVFFPPLLEYLHLCLPLVRASAIFIGVYEPTKHKLLKIFPENLSALAHIVSWLS